MTSKAKFWKRARFWDRFSGLEKKPWQILGSRQFRSFNGAKAILHGDPILAEKFLPLAYVTLSQLKLENDEYLDIVSREVPIPDGFIRVSTNGYDDKLEVFCPEEVVDVAVTSGAETSREVLADEIREIIVLVEDEDGTGFLMFTPAGAEAGSLRYMGYTNVVSAVNKDPLGIVGQETYRTGWLSLSWGDTAKFPVDTDLFGISHHIEQLKRVDQGWTAYIGDYSEEEITWILALTNVWTWEDVDLWTCNIEPWVEPYGIDWDEVMRSPEYCWDICEELDSCPDGLPEENSYTHGAYIVMSGDEVAGWTPLEMYRIRETVTKLNHNSFLARYVDLDNVYPSGLEELGVVASGAAAYFLPETYTMAKSETYSRRVLFYVAPWSTVLPSGALSGAYDVTLAEHPFTDFSPIRSGAYICEQNYFRAWNTTEGVYVYDSDEYFISGCVVKEGKFRELDFEYKTLRAEQIPEDWIRASSIPGVTADARILCNGNEDITGDWNYDSYTYQYYYEYEDETLSTGYVCIHVSGVDYVIMEELWPCFIPGALGGGAQCVEWVDYGIFTYNTGIDEDNYIIPDEITPVYTHSFKVLNEDGSTRGAVFGLVYNGTSYVSDEYEVEGSSVIVPEAPVNGSFWTRAAEYTQEINTVV